MTQVYNPFDSIEEEKEKQEDVDSVVSSTTYNPFDSIQEGEEINEEGEVVSAQTPTVSTVYNPFDLIEEGEGINEEGEIVEEPTIARKVAYGTAQEPMVLGSVGRLMEAGYETLFEDKDWEQARADVEAERQEEIFKEFPEFKSGEYETDPLVISGRVGTAIADPVTYFVPWVKAAKAGKIVLAATGATTASGEFALHSYALTGEVDPKMFTIVMGSGGVLAPAGDTFIKFLNKRYSKSIDEEDIIKKVESRVIRGTDDISKLTAKEQELINESFKLPSVKGFYSQLKNIDNNTKLLRGLNAIEKDVKLGNLTKQEARPLQLRIKEKLDKKFLSMTDMRTKAQIEIAELLYKNKSFSAKAFESAIRPMFGTLMLGGSGIALDANDSQLYALMAIGFGSGALSRKLKNNTFLPQEIKQEVMKSAFRRQLAFTKRNIDINFSATLATKLKALGPETGYFSDLMFHQFKSRGARQLSVEERATMAYNHWMMTLYDDVLKTTSKETQISAVKILRGYAKDSDMTDEAIALSKRFRDFLDDYKAYHTDVDIHASRELTNYFPREYDFDLITKDGKAFKDTLAFIYSKQNPNKSEKAVNQFAKNFIKDFYINSSAPVSTINKSGKQVLDKLPFIKHIEKERLIHGFVEIDGKKVQVEELLEPWLKNDPAEILSNMVRESTKTVEFARTWGKNGELLSRLRKQIHDKYKGTVQDKRLYAEHNREIKFMNDAVNAYFGRYGVSNARGQNAAGTIAMYNNLSMLEDVSLANLGDLIQPFQNSTFFKSAIKGLKKTSPTKTKTALDSKEPARYLAMKQTQELQNEIQELSGITNNTANVIKKTNQGFFKIIGLQNVTSYARRFAYNSGAIDSYDTAVKWVNLNNKNIKAIEKKTGKKWSEFTHDEHVKLLAESKLTKKTEHLRKRLSYSGISTAEAKRIAQYKTFDEAFDSEMKYALNTAGFRAMERDSKIPTVGNRLLYTQSKNPWIKLVGQFSSWAQAKTAQINSLVSRIEDGDTRLAIKMAGLLSIYGGVKELREIIADGDLSRESKDWGKFLADANQLSGNTGFFGNLASQQYINKYGKDPLNFFPAASTISRSAEAVRSLDVSDPEFTPEMERLLPIPKTINILQRTFGREVYEEPSIYKERTYEEPEESFSRGGLVTQAERLGFSNGGEVSQDKTSNNNPLISESSIILADNPDVPFVDRILNPQNYPTPERNEHGDISTHNLSAEIDEEGNAYVFPTKVYEKSLARRPEKSYKQYDDNYQALEDAKARGDVIKFDSIDEAVSFTKNYKPKSFLDYYEQKPSLVERISKDYQERVDASTQSFLDYKSGKIGRFRRAVNNVGNLAGLAFDAAGRVIESGLDTYLESLEATSPEGYKNLSEDLKNVKDWVLETDAGQAAVAAATKGMKEYGKWKRNNPQDAQTFESIVNIGMFSWGAKSIAQQMNRLIPDKPLEGEVLPPIKVQGDLVPVPPLVINQTKDGLHISSGNNASYLNVSKKDTGMMVTSVNVDPRVRRRGVALSMYKEAIKDAKKKNINLTSDLTVKLPALAVYRKLEEEGYNVEFNPNTTDVTNDEGVVTRVSTDDLPVVTVHTKDKATIDKEKRNVKLKEDVEGLIESGGFKYKLPAILLDLTTKDKLAPVKPNQWKNTLNSWSNKGKIKKEELEDSRIVEWLDTLDKDKKVSTNDIFNFMQENSPMLKTYTSKLQDKADAEWLENQPLYQEKVLLRDSYHNKLSEVAYLQDISNISDTLSFNDAKRIRRTADWIHHVSVEDIINSSYDSLSVGSAFFKFLSNSPYTIKAIKQEGAEAKTLGDTSSLFHPDNQKLRGTPTERKNYIREATAELASNPSPEKRNVYMTQAILEDLNKAYIKAPEGTNRKELLKNYLAIMIDNLKAKQAIDKFERDNSLELSRLSDEAMERTSGDVEAGSWSTYALANTRGKPVTILVQSKVGKEDRLKHLEDFITAVKKQKKFIPELEKKIDSLKKHKTSNITDYHRNPTLVTKHRIKVERELRQRKETFKEETGVDWDKRDEYYTKLKGDLYVEPHYTGAYGESPIKKGIPKENIILHIRGNLIEQGSFGKGKGLFVGEQQSQAHQTAMGNKRFFKNLVDIAPELKDISGYAKLGAGDKVLKLIQERKKIEQAVDNLWENETNRYSSSEISNMVIPLDNKIAKIETELKKLTGVPSINSIHDVYNEAIPENISHKKDWTPLAMKQMIKYAVDNNLNYIVLPIEKHSIDQIEQWGGREPGVMKTIIDRNTIYSPRAYRSIVKKWDKDAKPRQDEYLDRDEYGNWEESNLHKVIVLPITEAIKKGVKSEGLDAYRRGGLVTQMKALSLND